MINQQQKFISKVFSKAQFLTYCSYSFCSIKPVKISSYKDLCNNDLNYFQQNLSESEIITDYDKIQQFNVDWPKTHYGFSKLVLAPKSTKNLSNILSYCNKNNLALSIQGGNTGLSGGSIPVYDEIILSMHKMNKIIHYDQQKQVLTTQAGCILEQINKYLLQYNVEIPLDLGAKGSCQIGGNVSTNAGGKYFIKYGPFRCNILGIEVVLANGQILNMTSHLRKDNTGMDLKQLFIGSEGSLGVISQIDIACQRLLKHKSLMVFQCSSYKQLLNLFTKTKLLLGNNLQAVEWMDSYSMQLVLKMYSDTIKYPFEQPNEIGKHYYLFVELGCNHSNEILEQNYIEGLENNDKQENNVVTSSNKIINNEMNKKYIQKHYDDCLQSTNQKQFDDLWAIRDLMGPAIEKYGHDFKYDISVNPEVMNTVTCEMRSKVEGKAICVGFGHIGDENLHLLFSCHKGVNPREVEELIEPYIYQQVQKIGGGSISAEHGIGLIKVPYLSYQKSDLVIDYMKKIKKYFDPKGILNPYKVLPNQQNN